MSAFVTWYITHELIVDEWRRHDEICGCSVARNWDVPDHGYSQERLDVRVMGLWLEWVPEEQQHIDVTFRDSGANLLVATKWSTA